MLETTEQPAAPDSTAAEAATQEVSATPAPPADQTAAPDPLEGLFPVEDDEAEDEIEGVKVKGKKEALERLKAERLMHADYTRKTQAAAEERRALESEREHFSRVAQLNQQFIKEVAQIHAVDERLEQYNKLDWGAVIAQDPTQAQRLQAEFSQLQVARGQLANSLTQKQQQLQADQQQTFARRAADAQAYVMREIKDWSPEKDRELETFAKGRGLDPLQLRQFAIMQPAIVPILDAAARFDKLLKQRTAKPPAPPAQPVTRVTSAASPAVVDEDKMPTEEWRAYRDKQIAAKRKKR